ncbi:MAG: glycosyltransferase family 2 protein, partial [Fervidobacterium pennivorans]
MLYNILITTVTIFISIIYFFRAFKRRLRLFRYREEAVDSNYYSISVIIPARNEERNIAKILTCLRNQSVQPNEIIVVDDNSADNTYEIASKFDGVKCIRLQEEPPEGWVGKPWAIWNGVKASKGDLLIFFDADVEPEYYALETLLNVYKEYGGLISVWPYQRFERFYEHFTAVFNALIIYGGNMIGFPFRKPSGAFGPVILTSRKDYEYTGGHQAIKDSVLEDIKLGKLYIEKGISVNNFLGDGIIKFRMYPNGFAQLFEGFAKNMSFGASTGGSLSFLLAMIWISGYFSSFSNFNYLIFYTAVRYIIMCLLFYLLLRPTGDYKWYDALFYP